VDLTVRSRLYINTFSINSKEVEIAELRRDNLSIYVPQDKVKEQPIERLMRLAKQRDRSVNYLVVKAIMEFLEREEKK
jgi:hypothetical protein